MQAEVSGALGRHAAYKSVENITTPPPPTSSPPKNTSTRGPERGIIQALDVDWQVPFTPHSALTLHLSREPRLLVETTARRPTPLPKDFPVLPGKIPAQDLKQRWSAITDSDVNTALETARFQPVLKRCQAILTATRRLSATGVRDSICGRLASQERT